MRILAYSSYYIPHLSGLSILFARIMNALAQTNSLTLLTFTSGGISSQANVIQLPFLSRLSKGYISPQAWFFFFKYVKQADMILLNLPGPESLLLAILARLTRKPLVSVYHCHLSVAHQGLEKAIVWLANLTTNVQLHLSNKIITTSEDYATAHLTPKLLAKNVSLTPPLASSPPDGQFSQILLTKKNEHRWIGFVGRQSREKGIETLLSSLSSLTIPKPFALIIASPHPGKIVGESKYIKRLIKQLNRANISVLHFYDLTDAQLTSLLHLLDLLVLPSINSTEAFGLVQGEAMAVDTPVIATDLPGVRVPIKRTGMGLIVPPGNAPALAAAIQNIFNHRAKYVNPATRQKVKAFFDNQKNLKAYVDTITSN